MADPPSFVTYTRKKKDRKEETYNSSGKLLAAGSLESFEDAKENTEGVKNTETYQQDKNKNEDEIHKYAPVDLEEDKAGKDTGCEQLDPETGGNGNLENNSKAEKSENLNEPEEKTVDICVISRRITENLDTLENLRTKSKNLSGRVSGEMKVAICKVREDSVSLETMAMQAKKYEDVISALKGNIFCLEAELFDARNNSVLAVSPKMSSTLAPMELHEEVRDNRPVENKAGKRPRHVDSYEEDDTPTPPKIPPKNARLYSRVLEPIDVATQNHQQTQGTEMHDYQAVEDIPCTKVRAHTNDFPALPKRNNHDNRPVIREIRSVNFPINQVNRVPPAGIYAQGNSNTTTYQQNNRDRTTHDEIGVELIVIKCEGSNFNILTASIKNQVKPDNYGVSVLSLKKSLKGNIEIRVRGTEQNVRKFKKAIENTVQEKGEVSTLQMMAFVHVCNLDPLATKEEVLQDVAKACDLEEKDVIVTSLRPAFGEAQKATIKLPRSAALKLDELRRITVGYVSCRVFLREFEPRCYRCGENGHTVQNCNGRDKTGRCFRCEANDHLARDCPVRIPSENHRRPYRTNQVPANKQ